MQTTDSQTEQLIRVDEYNHVIGPISRGDAHKTPGIYYRTIYILVKNNKGEILLQKRSPTKDLYPNCWDLSVGGHVNFGQEYLETAVRELKEELGIDAQENNLKFVGEVLVRLPQSGEYFYVYEYVLKPTEELHLAKDEVSDIQWMTIEDIKKSMELMTLQWYTRPIQTIKALYQLLLEKT